MLSPTRPATRKRAASALASAPKRPEVKSEDDNEDGTLLGTYDGPNATGLQRTYSEVTESVNESISDGINNLMRIMYGIQTQVGTLCTRVDKQDARFEGLAKSKTASSTAQQEDTKKRVLSGADFCDRKNAGRGGQKDNLKQKISLT